LQEGLVPEHRASPSREKRPSSYKGGPALAGITGAWRDRTVLITRMNTPAHSKYRKADTGLDRRFCFRVKAEVSYRLGSAVPTRLERPYRRMSLIAQFFRFFGPPGMSRKRRNRSLCPARAACPSFSRPSVGGSLRRRAVVRFSESDQ
jgi:hypothetical protein